MIKPLANLTNINIALATAIVTVIGSFGLYFYQKRKRNEKLPSNWEPVGKVTHLYVYPLKSGRRIPVKKADCTTVAFKICYEDEKAFQLSDRSFVIYGEKDKEFKTARTYPKMILIETSVHDNEHLAFDAPGMRQLYVKIPTNDQPTQVMMRGEKISGYDCGDEAATWISRYLEKDGFRLAYFDFERKRDINVSYSKFLPVYPNLSSESMGLFTDLGSCLLINEASVDDLNNKIQNSNVTHENFRPNIVISGAKAPAYCEDEWDWIKIGDVVFRVALPCTRCILTTINPSDGIRNQNREPLNTLEKYRILERELPEKAPAMGIMCNIKVLGKISVDDVVYIGKD